MELGISFSPLLALLIAGVIGGVFGIAASAVANGFGRGRVWTFWLLTSICLGAAGATHALLAQHKLGLVAARASEAMTFALFIVPIAVVLSLPTLAVWRHARTGRVHSTGRQALMGVAWTLLGLIVAAGIVAIAGLAIGRFFPMR